MRDRRGSYVSKIGLGEGKVAVMSYYKHIV